VPLANEPLKGMLPHSAMDPDPDHLLLIETQNNSTSKEGHRPTIGSSSLSSWPSLKESPADHGCMHFQPFIGFHWTAWSVVHHLQVILTHIEQVLGNGQPQNIRISSQLARPPDSKAMGEARSVLVLSASERSKH